MHKRATSFLISLTLAVTTATHSGQVDQSQVVFLFDIHDVFLKKKVGKVGAAIWKNKYALVNIPAIFSLAQLGWKHLTDQEVTSQEYIQSALEHKSPLAAQMVKEIANAQEPIEDTVTIIRELADAGYPLHIGSNIGTSSFTDISDHALYPELAAIIALFDIPHSQISIHTPKRTIKKPNPEFFEQYLLKNGNPDPSTIIFIDDNSQNIATAKKMGFEAITFESPQQLRQELIKRGFTFLNQA